MTKDYRRSVPTSRPTHHRSPRQGTCVFWFLFGALCGAFGIGFVWIREPAPLPEAAIVEPTAPPDTATQTPTFGFYDRLSHEEVMVPADDTTPAPSPLPAITATNHPVLKNTFPTPEKAAISQQPKAQSTSENSRYQLQIASFRDQQDAEHLKAELALKGIFVTIEPATVAGTKTYRVRSTLQTKSDIETLHDQLQRSGHQSLLMKVQ
jgi:cell division protein FtsN